jgi:transcription initiation factor TFIID TATA-box-binding protein
MNPDIIKVENLVFTCKLSSRLNLRDVTTKSRGKCSYNPKKFAAAIQRYSDPKIAVLMFSPGKFVCTGSKTDEQAIFIVDDVVTGLRDNGYDFIYIERFNIQNVVCRALLGVPIDCDLLAAERSGECNYEPDLFPGVVMRHEPIKPVTVLVFKSGKMVLTGAKSETEARSHFNTLYEIIKKYIRPVVYIQDNIFGQRTNIINNLIKEEVLENPIKSEIIKNEIIEVKQEFIEPEYEYPVITKKIRTENIEDEQTTSTTKRPSIVERKYTVTTPIKHPTKIQEQQTNDNQCIYCHKYCSRKNNPDDIAYENICCICLHSEDTIHEANESNTLCEWCKYTYKFKFGDIFYSK